MRLQVERQKEDARVYLDADGVTVVAVKAGLLSHRAEIVIARALALIPEHRHKAAERVPERRLRKVIDNSVQLGP